MNEGVGSGAQEKVLGYAIGKARRKAGLTQQELCAKANLSYSTLAKIERGAIKTPSIFTVAAIAQATGTTIEALAGLESSGAPIMPPRALKTSKTGIKFVYFDVNGVLVRFYQRAFTKIAHDYGVRVGAIENIYWHYVDDVCSGRISMSDFNSVLSDRVGGEKVDWSEYYLKNIDPVADAKELLEWVSKYYMVGLISNTMPRLLSTMRQQDTIPDINYDVVIDSSEVKLIKPDPAIFELASKQSSVRPEEILLIDDSSPNLMSAGNLGWHVMWFDSYQPEESAERIREALEF